MPADSLGQVILDPEEGFPPWLVHCRGVSVDLGRGAALVHALVDVHLTVGREENLAIRGRSGSGKSTLLHVLGRLTPPTAGTLESVPPDLRVGHVFQSPNLLPHLTAVENVAFSAHISQAGHADSHASTQAAGWPSVSPLDLLEMVGLQAKADHLPAELSGGEAQRAAIARGLAVRPGLLLCDEPTGHLDSTTAERVFALLQALQRELGFSLVIATHDDHLSAQMPRVVELSEGRVLQDHSLA